MMKKYIISILIICVGVVPVLGQTLVEKANAEYDRDKYQNALNLYLQAATFSHIFTVCWFLLILPSVFLPFF